MGFLNDVFSYTPVGVVVDVASGNPTAYEEAFAPPPRPPPPPTDNRPTCDSYKSSGLSDAQLRSFDTDPDCKGTNTLSSWLEQQRIDYCNVLNNYTKNPGGEAGSCAERNRGKDLALEYCSQGDNIKKSTVCTREYLGDVNWVELAKTYCKGDGQAESWCSCYNVLNNVCDTNENAAGCPEKASSYDLLVQKTPEAFRDEWAGRAQCYGIVCQESESGAKYIPENANQKCDSPIQICGQSVQAEGISESTIDATCYIGGRPVDQGGDRGGDQGGDGDFTENLFAQIQEYIPTSIDDLTGDDTNKKIGAASAGASLFMCCACIIVLILMVTSKGQSRFKR